MNQYPIIITNSHYDNKQEADITNHKWRVELREGSHQEEEVEKEFELVIKNNRYERNYRIFLIFYRIVNSVWWLNGSFSNINHSLSGIWLPL